MKTLESAIQIIEKQKKEIVRLHVIISGMQYITRNSHGVAGWHLNGDIATWEELLDSEELMWWR